LHKASSRQQECCDHIDGAWNVQRDVYSKRYADRPPANPGVRRFQVHQEVKNMLWNASVAMNLRSPVVLDERTALREAQ
jgi:hypothetical protein